MWDRGDQLRQARVSDRAAKEAAAAGRNVEAEGYRAEAQSWRAGKPQSDPRVPRARYRRENKAALANAVDPDRLIRELTEGK